VPYDALAVTQSFITKPFSLEGSIVFCYGAAVSCVTATFTSWLYMSVNQSNQLAPGHEIREGVGYLSSERRLGKRRVAPLVSRLDL
jgi:cell division protein FtsX